MALSKISSTFRNFQKFLKPRGASSNAVALFTGRPKHTIVEMAKKHYAVTYLCVLTVAGCVAMIYHATNTALYNPSIDLPFWDKVPRYDTYAGTEYKSILPPNRDPRKVPVLMRHDGSLNFMDGEKIEPAQD